MPEASLGPLHDLCPVCGGWDSREAGCRLQADPPVEMLSCSRCGAASASRFPDEPFLKILYAPDRYASDLLSSSANTRRCAEHIASLLPVDPKRDVRVLDYGGSDGGLSRALGLALRGRGHRGAQHFTVVDYFVEERGQEGLRFIDVDEFATLTERFDVVLASAVLEHLTDLPGTAARLLALCRPGGWLYARTPYELPLARWVPGYAVRWPRHVHDLGPLFWSRFLETFGYRGALVRSAPSFVESGFAARPVRSLVAHALKAPGHLEMRWRADAVRREGRTRWPFVGGWEALLRVDGQVRDGSPPALGHEQ